MGRRFGAYLFLLEEFMLLTCFNSPMRITQLFGNKLYVLSFKNPLKFVGKDCPGAIDYYAHYGLTNGHNGVDVVPMDMMDLKIYTFWKGIVCLIQENHKEYGNRVATYNKDTGLVEYHNHMEKINTELKIGQELTQKSFVGVMGTSGMSSGRHDHLGLCEVDKTCFNSDGIITTRLNMNNGWGGWLNVMAYM
jgi:hypothetical protein